MTGRELEVRGFPLVGEELRRDLPAFWNGEAFVGDIGEGLSERSLEGRR